MKFLYGINVVHAFMSSLNIRNILGVKIIEFSPILRPVGFNFITFSLKR
jgi:hypothetical protein